MLVILNGKELEAPVVGSYGTEGYPVVEVDGMQFVAEESFINSNGSRGSSVCQSCGCDHCEGNFSGCRYGENRNLSTGWFI